MCHMIFLYFFPIFAIMAAAVLDAADWLPPKSTLHLAYGKMGEKVLRPLWKQEIADFQRSTAALKGGCTIFGKLKCFKGHLVLLYALYQIL